MINFDIQPKGNQWVARIEQETLGTFAEHAEAMRALRTTAYERGVHPYEVADAMAMVACPLSPFDNEVVPAAAFFECPVCHYFHPVDGIDFRSLCGREDQQFEAEALDEQHPGWTEIRLARPNLFLLRRLTPEVDLHGNALTRGCKVRVHLAMYDPVADQITGIDPSAFYYEGRLGTIGAAAQTPPIARYQISVDYYKWRNHRDDTRNGEIITPPVNGSPTQMGWPTFSVFRLF